ncbi:MAG: hypothetical protein ACI4UO_05740, partial [Paludibacteraceae bacterium]
EVQEEKRKRNKVVGITTIVLCFLVFIGLAYGGIPVDFRLPRRHLHTSNQLGINLFYIFFLLYVALTVVYSIVKRVAQERVVSAFIATVGILCLLSFGGLYIFVSQQDRSNAISQEQPLSEQAEQSSSQDSAVPPSKEPSGFARTGTLRLEGGVVYSGELVNGKPHGEGVLASPKGFRYKGAFRNGVPDGKGKISMQDGSWEAEGVFYQTEPVGVCTLYWHLPAGERRYVGEVEKLEPHGKGTMYETDGAIYEGTFCHGQKHGSGEYTYTDGSTFKGIWENNKLIHKEQ